MMADTDERFEAIQRRLTPEVREAVGQRLEGGRYPRALIGALSRPMIASVTADAGALESQLPYAALEAIVQLTGRPPMMVRNDAVVLEPLPDLPAGTDLKIRAVQKWIPSVGRIEFVNAPTRWGGTGWVVGERGQGRLVVTNRHVAKLVARRMADGSGVYLRSAAGIRMGANIDFREEQGSVSGDAGRTASLAAVEYLADDLAADIALLRIDAADFALPTPMRLASAEAAVGQLVALIGYPAFDPRNDADAQARYFQDLYDVKRFAPGRIIQPLTARTALSHDCTSLGGNSGSPLVDLDTGEVVGLHFSGIFGKENIAVGAATLAALLGGTRTVVAAGGGGEAAGGEEAADGAHAADHFAGRAGFDQAFLGPNRATPWPGLPVAVRLAAPSDDPPEPGELRYTHFGVKYSAAERLPLMTAVNIDGARSVRIKRGTDRWFSDGRIPADVQLRRDNFADAEIDRGHMVRREDPNWGTPEEARQANDDTFHYVNAAPQHALLNQGRDLWQGLENYILDSARTDGFRACVFTGPVLGPDDATIDGARVPDEYWKLVAMANADGPGLHATAYLLSQGQMIRDLLEKRGRLEAVQGVELGAYRTFQIAVADLAEATGYDLSAYAAADPLARARDDEEGADPGAPLFRPIDRAADIVL